MAAPQRGPTAGFLKADRPWLATDGHSLFMEKPSLVTDKTNSVTELPFSMTDRPSLLMEIPLFVMDLTKSVMELPLSMTNKTKFMKEIPLSVMELPLLLNNQCPSVTDKGLSVVKFSQLEAEFDDFNEKT